MIDAEIVVSRSTPADVPAWRRLAADVEREFGAPAASERWIARLEDHIAAGRAWCARHAADGEMVGGMWLTDADTDVVTIDWLAVRPDHRRRGVATALLEEAVARAAGRPMRVVTFGEGHPLTAEANAALELYVGMGFEPAHEVAPDGPDGTPRGVLRRPGASHGGLHRG